MPSVESVVFVLIIRMYVEYQAQRDDDINEIKTSRIPIADQNFGTNRFLPLFTKSVHKVFVRERAYSILYEHSLCL